MYSFCLHQLQLQLKRRQPSSDCQRYSMYSPVLDVDAADRSSKTKKIQDMTIQRTLQIDTICCNFEVLADTDIERPPRPRSSCIYTTFAHGCPRTHLHMHANKCVTQPCELCSTHVDLQVRKAQDPSAQGLAGRYGRSGETDPDGLGPCADGVGHGSNAAARMRDGDGFVVLGWL